MKKNIFNFGLAMLSLLMAVPTMAGDEPLCVGDSVISVGGCDGSVKGIFPNGNVSVYFSTDHHCHGGIAEMNPHDLARVDGCADVATCAHHTDELNNF